MLYLLHQLFANDIRFFRIFKSITIRGAIAFAIALIFMLIFGKPFIAWLKKKKYGDTAKDCGPQSHFSKSGTPTMGGLIIILATLIPVLLFTRILNIYIILLIISVVWMGAIGFIDDYLKKIKKNKDGLSGKFKVIGQVGLGLIVGVLMYFHPDVTVKRKYADAKEINRNNNEKNFMPTPTD